MSALLTLDELPGALDYPNEFVRVAWLRQAVEDLIESADDTHFESGDHS